MYSRVGLWLRLMAGLVLLVLNLTAIIVVVHGYRFDFARITLRVALFANVFVAGMLLGGAALIIFAPYYESLLKKLRKG